MGGIAMPEPKLYDSMKRTIKVTPMLSFREFAEKKIVLPDGPYAGLRLRVSRQPYLGHVLDAMDSGQYSKFVFTGPVQSGKTLSILIPLTYHLFEIGETVVFGVPTDDIASEKWTKDILPIIDASPAFSNMLPKKGPGSRNSSNPSMVTFRNGATLKFMTGRGRDESRSHFTARVVLMSEVDKMDKANKVSRESDPVRQLEGRAGAYGHGARIYMECSPSYSTGRIWTEYEASTASRIALTCPYCSHTRLFGRQDFKGWEAAKTATEAEETGRFHCPACDTPWTKEDRLKANASSVVVHAGQDIEGKDKIVGEQRRSTAFGLNWNAPHNMFTDEQTLAAKEFVAANDANDLDESGEKDVLQQRWGMPYSPPQAEFKQARVGDITARIPKPDSGLVKGVVPADADKITIGLDIGKHWLHWVALSRHENGRRHIFDYDTVEVASDAMPEEHAITKALSEIWEMKVSRGWPTTNGDLFNVANFGIDAGNWTNEAVYPFLQQMPPEVVIGTMGYGYDQRPGSAYRPTNQKNKKYVGLEGVNFHVVHVPDYDVWRADFDADHYKSVVQQGLTLPMSSPRSVTLYYKKNPKEHITFAKHLASETMEHEFITGKGWQARHVQRYWQNHYLDAAAIAWLCMDVSDTAEQVESQQEGSSEPDITLHPVLGDTNGQESI